MQRPSFRWRVVVVFLLLVTFLLTLLWRLIDLSIVKRDFLLRESKARIFRTVSIAASRGMITDRSGAPLAISTPVKAIWINPQAFKPSRVELQEIAHLLGLTPHSIRHKRWINRHREFAYLERGVSPMIAARLRALNVRGLFQQTEYKRFYPQSEVTSHVLGFTNIDDVGQEGLELGFNGWLTGSPGKKQVLKDRLGQIIANVALVREPQQGHDLQLSIDHRIQYLAYRVLKQAVQKYHARSGSVVVLKAKSGEVLAMVNQPAYNPNHRLAVKPSFYRNRAVTDLFEPGSTMKPFTMAYALSSGRYQPNSIIDTNPGWMVVGGYTIRDDNVNHGKICLTEVLQKSSNIGVAKVLLSLRADQFWRLLRQFGFGGKSTSGFPGEASGTLVEHATWQPSLVATLAYGYGISVTALQLAHAYQVLANDGKSLPLSFVYERNPPPGIEVVKAKVARQVVHMLETVVQRGGTGTKARIPGYRVAGKTGTAYIAGPQGYDRKRYIASFAGLAPASDPQLVVVVVIHEPQGRHFGGLVAAPVFAKIMGGALRFMDIAPDDILRPATKSG